jgi:hypothetical protein
MAVVLWLLAVGLLIISVLFDGDPTSTWSQLLAVAASWAGPILLVLALVFSVRTWLTKLLRRQIVDLAGPAMIRSMPPRTVLGALLPWVYGDRTDYREVLTGVLGGASRDAEGRDTAVSRRTTAVFRLHAIDQSTCRSDTTWTHEFSGVRNNHRFVISRHVTATSPPTSPESGSSPCSNCGCSTMRTSSRTSCRTCATP